MKQAIAMQQQHLKRGTRRQSRLDARLRSFFSVAVAACHACRAWIRLDCLWIDLVRCARRNGIAPSSLCFALPLSSALVHFLLFLVFTAADVVVLVDILVVVDDVVFFLFRFGCDAPASWLRVSRRLPLHPCSFRWFPIPLRTLTICHVKIYTERGEKEGE